MENITKNFVALSAAVTIFSIALAMAFLLSYLSVFDWNLIWIIEYTDLLKFGAIGMVIPPFLTGFARRIYAANFSFCAGVMPPMPMLGRSLL